MLDRRFIRDNPEAVKAAVRVKGIDLDVDDGLSRSGSAAPAMPASTARRASRGASAVMVPMTARPVRPSDTATSMKLGRPCHFPQCGTASSTK